MGIGYWACKMSSSHVPSRWTLYPVSLFRSWMSHWFTVSSIRCKPVVNVYDSAAKYTTHRNKEEIAGLYVYQFSQAFAGRKLDSSNFYPSFWDFAGWQLHVMNLCSSAPRTETKKRLLCSSTPTVTWSVHECTTPMWWIWLWFIHFSFCYYLMCRYRPNHL